jgi:hypothetical protein
MVVLLESSIAGANSSAQNGGEGLVVEKGQGRSGDHGL